MGNNISIGGTAHLRAVLNAAMESETGVRIEGLSKTEAVKMRAMLHSLRADDRKRSQKMYRPEEPGYGQSPYDCLLTEILPEGDEASLTATLRIVRSSAKMKEFPVVDNASGKPIDLEDFQ